MRVLVYKNNQLEQSYGLEVMIERWFEQDLILNKLDFLKLQNPCCLGKYMPQGLFCKYGDLNQSYGLEIIAILKGAATR